MRNQWIETCKASNDSLCTVNSELLDLLAGAGPVTGMVRVRSETVVQDYRYKPDTLKMTEFTESTTATSDDPSAVSATP